ncbi:MAG: VTC domain-containing protein [Spirochaetales bacterium]|nr:VTC domain-containing protein [Spirochaetales bacterium]
MSQDHFRRIEQKYLFHAGYTDMIREWVDHACVADPLYPCGVVSSLYYDTPELLHFHESRNGDFQRAKVRLRWYLDPTAAHPDAGVPCFLEVKSKQGALTGKRRKEVAVRSAVLYGDPFTSREILDLPERVLELGYQAAGMLVPVLLIQYRRRRYHDVASGCGISLDGEICCSRVNERVVQGTPPVFLDVGVLEIKGMNRRNRDLLEPIGSYLSRSPFSKYAVGLETLMQPVARRV